MLCVTLFETSCYKNKDVPLLLMPIKPSQVHIICRYRMNNNGNERVCGGIYLEWTRKANPSFNRIYISKIRYNVREYFQTHLNSIFFLLGGCFLFRREYNIWEIHPRGPSSPKLREKYETTNMEWSLVFLFHFNFAQHNVTLVYVLGN